MISQPSIATSRIVLRPFTPSDVNRVAELANDEEVARNSRSFSYPYSTEDAANWIGEVGREWDQGKSVVFAVSLQAIESQAEQLVGSVGLVLDQQSNRGELGYWLGRSYWGQGIATEACVSILDFAFGELLLNKVVAECLVRNSASEAVLKKIGMVQEGHLKNHFRKSETDPYCDVRVFGLLRDAWNQRK